MEPFSKDMLINSLIGKQDGIQLTIYPSKKCSGCQDWQGSLFFEASAMPYLVEDRYTGDSVLRNVHALSESRVLPYHKDVGETPTKMRITREPSEENKLLIIAHHAFIAIKRALAVSDRVQATLERGERRAEGLVVIDNEAGKVKGEVLISKLKGLFEKILNHPEDVKFVGFPFNEEDRGYSFRFQGTPLTGDSSQGETIKGYEVLLP